MLAADPDIEVVGEAADGKRAIELCQRLRPDVITMDMMLPVMSGLAATEYIMAHCPTPILIVSSSINRGELFKTYDALAAGAVDVLEKPRGDEPDGDWERRFLAAVKLVVADPGHHPPARAPRRGLGRATERAGRTARDARDRRRAQRDAWSPSARRPAGRARWSRSCAALPARLPAADPARPAHRRAVRRRVRRLARRADARTGSLRARRRRWSPTARAAS